MCILDMYVARSGCRAGEGVGVVLSSAKIGTSSWRYYAGWVRRRVAGTAGAWSGSGSSRVRW
jgi:hypothetical protein